MYESGEKGFGKKEERRKRGSKTAEISKRKEGRTGVKRPVLMYSMI